MKLWIKRSCIFLLKLSRARLRHRNEFTDQTWRFSDSEIVRELSPDMDPASWEPISKQNRLMCALMILERQSHKKMNKASKGISIGLLV